MREGERGLCLGCRSSACGVLQYFPPPDNPAVLRGLTAVLRRVIAGSEPHKNVNKNNAQHAVVFEAIALALALEADAELLTASVALLARFISVREPNIKYLGLENLVRLAEVPAVADTIARCARARFVGCGLLGPGRSFGASFASLAAKHGADIAHLNHPQCLWHDLLSQACPANASTPLAPACAQAPEERDRQPARR